MSTVTILPDFSLNVLCAVVLVSLTFVTVVGVVDITFPVGEIRTSVHTIVLLLQPGDVEAL